MASNTVEHTTRKTDSVNLREYLSYIPSGDTIPDAMWRARHRNILIAIFAHIPLLLALGLYSGTEGVITGATIPETPLWRVLIQLGLIGGTGLLALWPKLSRRVRTALSSTSLVIASTSLVFLSGGFIEAHFHFFVAIVVLALYEDWLPLVVGIGVVAISHTLFGVIEPTRVYNHIAAIENPFVWGGIHAAFVLAGAVALTTQWYSTERSRERVEQQLQEVESKRSEIDDLEEKKVELQQAKEKAEQAQAEAQAKQDEVERLNDALEAKADAYSKTMQKAADGDFTVRVNAQSESEEMVQIGEAFNEMMDDTESAMADIQTFAQEVATTSEEADSGVIEVKEAAGAVSESIQEVAGGTDDQRDKLDAVSGEVTELSAAVEEVAASAETVSETSSQMATAAQEGEQTARSTIQDVRQVQTELQSTVDNIQTLDGRMDEINDIIDLIGDIAEQTNMLALNANIEAARVGSGNASSDGDGFDVVAGEVKQLAEETKDAAGEIKTLIEQTQEQTTTTVEEAQAANESMEQGVTSVEKVADAFDRVSRSVEEVDSGIKEISDATDDQAASAEEVASTISEVAEIGEQMATESSNVSAAAEEQASSMTEISGSVTSLSDQAEELQTLLSEFTVSGTTSMK